jgi:hypothetical protein
MATFANAFPTVFDNAFPSSDSGTGYKLDISLSRVPQTIKSGDTAIQFTSTLIKDDGLAWTLEGSTVSFILKKGSYYESFPAEIVFAAAKVVRYTVDENFPTEPGLYVQEWKVEFDDGTILRFPSNNYNRFSIKSNLEPYDDIS